MMLFKIVRILIAVSLFALLAGCTAIAPAPDRESGTVPPGEEEAMPCGTGAAGQQVWTDAEGGFCLVLPADYAAQSVPDGIVFVLGDIMNHVDPRLEVTSEELAGRTLEEIATELAEQYGLPGTPVVRADAVLDGREAIVLDQLPGQDLNRRVVAVNNGRLYQLWFTPLGDAMERFYGDVMASWRFLEQPAPAAGTAALSYRTQAGGPSTGGELCAGMELADGPEVTLLSCDGAASATEAGARLLQEWTALQQMYASFELESEGEQLRFQGNGNRRDAAGQRALLAWARTTYAELASGQVSAAGRTVLSWFLARAEQPEVCGHLMVLDYGYAYADVVNCADNQVVEHWEGWLTSEELARLDVWLYNRAPFYQENNYLDGRGTTAVNEAESAEVNEWSASLFERLATP